MRAIVQRVKKASVTVTGKCVGEIGNGLFVLLGVAEGDGSSDAEKLADKIYKLRIMNDKEKKMNVSIGDGSGEIMIVSQFTLHADTRKGNRPSFIKAAKPQVAEKLYKCFIKKLENLGAHVETGVFGAYMEIKVKLDGPVTIIIDTAAK